MNKKEADKIALKYIEEIQKHIRFEIELAPELTITETFGWVYFYGAKDPELEIGGNAPFIVDAKTGVIEETGTAHATKHYIENYKKYGTCYPEEM